MFLALLALTASDRALFPSTQTAKGRDFFLIRR
jgi:hypothetical protein